MRIDLTNLFNGSNEVVSIDFTLDLKELEYSGYNPIRDGAAVNGSIYAKAGVVYLDCDVSFDFYGVCDRCAEDITKHFSFKLDKILVSEMANDTDFDDYIVVENGTLHIDELIEEEITLFLPAKMLCNEDCKGLCMTCGKNLNLGKCNCKKEVDPRMAALLQLLDEE